MSGGRSTAPEPTPVFGSVGEMAALIARRDWSRTPLGPIDGWPHSLRTTVGIMLNTRFPMFLFWGPEAIGLYNDAYRPSLGADKHPAALGQRGEECWSDIWHIIGPQITAVMTRGEQTWHSDQLVPFDRSGYLEEIYFTYSYSPVYDESGRVGGTLVVCSETTDQVVAGRRLTTLHRTSAPLGRAPSEVLAALRGIVADSAADIPFALLYRTTGPVGDTGRVGDTGTVGETGTPGIAELVWSTAGADPAGGRELIDPARWPVAEVASTGTAVTVSDVRERCGDVVGGPWPEPVRQAVVLPVNLRGRPRPDYVLVAAVSARKALDSAYREFLDLLAAHVARAVGDAQGLQEERRRTEALAALDHAKTRFFANVSHEFRTPLTLMLGPLEELLTSAYARPPTEQQQLEEAYRNALRLLRLVNGLLDFSRLESGRARADLRPVDLARLTVELASAFRSAAERCGLEFVVDCPPLPYPVAVDAGMWEKVVFNLLSNAVKFTFAGSITVRLRAAGDRAELTVADTGVGVPEEELPRLFERFHRVGDVRGRTHEGSGIGLALVTELVRLHDGTVTATSTLGEGSTFVVRLPLDRSTPTGTPTAMPMVRPAPGPGLTGLGLVDEIERWIDTEPTSPPVLTTDGAVVPAHVLVADDNADMRRYLTRLLGGSWRVSVAADGEQALELIRRHQVDLVLTDVMMPGLDGIGLVRAIRADPALAATPVILLSARAGADASVDALDAGADDYVVKPFAAVELVGRVRAALSTARERQQHLRVVQAHAGRLATVARMTARFATARTVEDVAAVVVTELPDAVHASVAAVMLRGEVHPGRGVAPSLIGAFRRLGRTACAEQRPALASPDLAEGSDAEARRAVADGLRTAGCSAAAVVPLPGPESAEGWLAVGWLAADGAPPAVVDTEALTALETVAQVTGQTVHRARRDEREREIARTLQLGVLPPAPPALPGVQIGWRFASATDGSTVGGDWYDAVELGAGRIGLVTGDVAGHGIGAVAAMTKIGAALRAYLAEGLPPAAALHQLNRLVLTDPQAPHATLVCAVLDVVTLDLVWSLAGHPPPLLLRDGTATPLDEPLGPPVGVVDVPGYEEAYTRLRTGDRLLLYTDGLIERRRQGIQLHRLVEVAAGAPTAPQALIDVLDAAFLTETREDDVAVMAVRID